MDDSQLSPQMPFTENRAQVSSETAPRLLVECRPSRLVVAHYDALPFPNLGPVQEVAFDVGVTAYGSEITLTGLVFKGYSGHQLLLEQRWPARIIQKRTGERDLILPAGTGIALRGLQFLLHGYELLTGIEVTAVGKLEDASLTLQAVAQIPVEYKPQQTDLYLPVEGTWWVIQGSDWTDQHKAEVFSQAFAVDFAKLGANNATFATDGQTNEDHFSWDRPVFATAGGKVVYVTFDMPDQRPGVEPNHRIFRDDMRRLLGNSIIISHANGEFSYYGHLQQASLQVNQGQTVRRGALLARVGNSGYSPGPHLHFHLMEGPNLLIDRGLPAKFSHFWAGGQWFEQPTYLPTRMIVAGPSRRRREIGVE